eukprot:767282-Hanusia_phi.AAC.2
MSQGMPGVSVGMPMEQMNVQPGGGMQMVRVRGGGGGGGGGVDEEMRRRRIVAMRQERRAGEGWEEDGEIFELCFM